MTGESDEPFPDLKGQAPLRLDPQTEATERANRPFPDLKGQAPLRHHSRGRSHH